MSTRSMGKTRAGTAEGNAPALPLVLHSSDDAVLAPVDLVGEPRLARGIVRGAHPREPVESLGGAPEDALPRLAAAAAKGPRAAHVRVALVVAVVRAAELVAGLVGHVVHAQAPRLREVAVVSDDAREVLLEGGLVQGLLGGAGVGLAEVLLEVLEAVAASLELVPAGPGLGGADAGRGDDGDGNHQAEHNFVDSHGVAAG